MKEGILHFIWKNQYFKNRLLTDNEGRELEIITPGIYNKRDAGPDFTQSQILLDGIKWTGQVEIHTKSSDWMRHGHQNDSAYANVILHVVYEYDMDILDQDGRAIPTLELKGLIPPKFMSSLLQLYQNKDPIPCLPLIHTVPSIKIHHWLDRLAAERLTEKSDLVIKKLEHNNGDWEATYIDILLSAMGFKVNKEPFLMLAQKIDWKWIQKNTTDKIKLQAYLYGIAGFLNSKPSDDYEKTLQKEFAHLQTMHGFRPLPAVVWRFSRMRPSNFPTIRIAQLSSLFHKHIQLFPAMLHCKSISDLKSYFDTEYPTYWKKHYAFGKKSNRPRIKPGKMSIKLLLINVVAPVLFAYGNYVNKKKYSDRAVDLWQSLPPENNRVTRLWKGTNLKAESAWDSQAIIHLNKNYCSKKRCLSCQIGKAILREAANKYVRQSFLWF